MTGVSVSSSFQLPCGVVLSNRLVKAALSELMANPWNNTATEELVTLYEYWGTCGFGLIISGNIFTQREYLESPFGLVVDGHNSEQNDLLRRMATGAKKHGSFFIAQLSHPGRQTSLAVSWHPVAPSAGRKMRFPLNILFRPARALTLAEIEELIASFCRTSRLLQLEGFDGIQLHAAHGYLLSQFLSPLTNTRQDRYGGSLENRSNILIDLLLAIKKECGQSFIVGVKLNASDFVKGGFTEEDALFVAQRLEETGVDFIEFSGGTYENHALFTQSGKSAREAFFLSFTETIRANVKAPLCVTGGFRSRDFMNECLSQDRLDLIGLGRPSCTEPKLTANFVEGYGKAFKDIQFKTRLNDLTGGLTYFWHQSQMLRIARGGLPDLSLSPLPMLLTYSVPMYLWHPARAPKWLYVALLLPVAFFALWYW